MAVFLTLVSATSASLLNGEAALSVHCFFPSFVFVLFFSNFLKGLGFVNERSKKAHHPLKPLKVYTRESYAVQLSVAGPQFREHEETLQVPDVLDRGDLRGSFQQSV